MMRLNLQLFAKSIDELAKETIRGNYGNGEARKKALGSNYSAVQTRVNEMLGVGTSKPTTTTPAPTPTTTTPPPATTNVSNTPSTPEIKGVDSSLINTIGSTFTESDALKDMKGDVTNRANAFMDYASNTDIIGSDIWAGMLTPYSKSSAVLQAEQLLQSKIDQGYAGTHKEALNTLLNDFMNREDFEYDVDKDQMFQQALASAMNSGKAAMQDTMGQAAALTGGYGSTYATSAGNQAYNAFIEDAYNNLPEYYNMALAAYEAEGQKMLQQYNMLDAADTKEYSQWYDDVNLSYRSTRDMVNDDYNQWSANNTMYTNAANMQLAENAQIGTNLYNAYNVSSNEYESAYTKDWQNWQQGVNTALSLAGMQNNDYWNNENMNFQKSESQREQSNWEKSYALDLANAGAKKDNSGNIVGANENWTQSEYNNATNKLEQGGEQAAADYIETIGRQHGWSETTIDTMIDAVVAGGDTPIYNKTATAGNDGGNNWGGKNSIDNNATVFVDGVEYRLDTLYDMYVDAGLSKADAKARIIQLQRDLGLVKK